MSHSLSSPPQIEKNKTTITNSNYASLYQLPCLPSSLSVPLAAGTSIPQPPPSPPPLEKKVSLTTPDRGKPDTKPAFLPSPPLTRDMPGAFPASRSPSPTVSSPQTPRNYSRGSNSYTASAYSSEVPPRSPINTPHSHLPRRPSGLRNLLNFRRTSQVSPDASTSRGESSRPSTPSVASTFRLTFGKLSGGSLWKRKSATRTPGDEQPPGGVASPVSNAYDRDEAELAAPRTVREPGRHSMSMNNRTNTKEFWRRKSSGTLNSDAFVAPKANGINAVGGEETPVRTSTTIEDAITRTTSPPPKLPELGGARGDLDVDEMFKNIR